MPPISVYIVEDETLVREGLKALLSLSPQVAIAGEAADGRQAVEEIPRLRPDVVLLDIRLPKLDGLGVLAALRRQQALPPTIVVTTFDDHEVVVAAVREGARGYLLKDVSLEIFLEALTAVAGGGTWLQPTITDRILRALREGPRAVPPLPIVEPLTEREVEVLRLMAGAYNNREIGAALGVAEGTVKNHVASILAKMGARDRMLAVLRAVDSGYL